MKPLHSTILASFGGVVAALGLASPAFAIMTAVGGACYFAGLTETVGRVAFPEERRWIRVSLGLLGALALTSVFGTIVYDLYKLDAVGLSWLLVTLPWLVFAVSPFASSARAHAASVPLKIEKALPEDTLSAVLLLVMIAADVAALRWLVGARTTEALRTPWEVVPPIFFLWIGLATFCLIALAYRKRYPHLTLAAATLHLFTLLAPAAIVYGIGYGFDPFVHQAAERLVAATGEITPKTPYYVGQYVLVTTIARLFHLGIAVVDRFLLAVMTALFLPAAATWLIRRGFGVSRALTLISTLGIFLLPLGAFIATTPQGLADLFFLLTVLLGTAWLCGHRPPLAYVLTLAAASLVIHPLAGIPAFCAVGLLMVVKLRHDEKLPARIAKAVIYGLLVLLTALIVPLTFALRDGSGIAAIMTALRLPITTLIERIPFQAPGVETRYRPLLDFAEFVVRNRDLLLFVMAGAGAFLLARRSRYRRAVLALGGLAVALVISSAILRSGFTFQNVIGYEQADYANRLYDAALLALAPLVLAAFAWWWRALHRADGGVRFLQALLFAAVVTALVYGAFPRLDDYRFSRGYAPSGHDVNAVDWINANATSPYAVLANQSVSAAALSEFGFKTYYGDQFYYSIPTGAPLYQYYLRMVYETPSREIMTSAMQELNVPTAYFVIDRYWTDAPRIIAQAKKTADDWHEVDGGAVVIFRYTLR